MFYTDVSLRGDFIYERGIDKSGARFTQKVKYAPTFYLSTSKYSKFKTIHGNNLDYMQFSCISDAREFINDYKDVENVKLYGNTNYDYCYIAEKYKNDIIFDQEKINICTIDIEVESENGFPTPENPIEKINAITITIRGKTVSFGLGQFSIPNIECRCFDNEEDLLVDFIDLWSSNYPDIVTGWYSKFFDLPYLGKRIEKLLGKKYLERLSPWNIVSFSEININNNEKIVCDIFGISCLDYMDLYKKFTFTTRESYKLDYIAEIELGRKKLDYSEYGSLKNFYTQNFQKFMEYNTIDVDIVNELDKKLNLINLALSMAYMAKVNYEDVFFQVRMWDTIIYNHLLKKDIIIPFKKNAPENEQYAGAYVKNPLVGLHKWVVSFDLTSLYPMLIIQYNIGPDTIIENSEKLSKLVENRTFDDLVNTNFDTDFLRKNEVCMTANKQFFSTKKQSFLSELMEEMFLKRKEAKKKMLEEQRLLETLEDTKENQEQIKKHKRLASIYFTEQLVRKINLNSCYGSVGNNYFRFFDIRQAEAITLSGQLSIKFIENKINNLLNKTVNTKNIDYVIAIDTDSIYLNFDPILQKLKPNETDKTKIINFIDKICKEILNPYIDKNFNELAVFLNAPKQKMDMKRECIADRGLWTAKKRYVLQVYDSEDVRYHEPKLKIQGIEVQRSSTPQVCREHLKTAISLILNGNENDLIEYVDNFRKEFKQLPPEKVAFPRSVNDLGTYFDKNTIFKKATPIAVKGALLYNNYIVKNKLDKKYQKIIDGDKIKFIYLKEPNPIKDKVISFLLEIPKEINLNKFIDYDLQFEKAFEEPLNTILNVVGWNLRKTNNLDSFFS